MALRSTVLSLFFGLRVAWLLLCPTHTLDQCVCHVVLRHEQLHLRSSITSAGKVQKVYALKAKRVVELWSMLITALGCAILHPIREPSFAAPDLNRQHFIPIPYPVGGRAQEQRQQHQAGEQDAWPCIALRWSLCSGHRQLYHVNGGDGGQRRDPSWSLGKALRGPDWKSMGRPIGPLDSSLLVLCSCM